MLTIHIQSYLRLLEHINVYLLRGLVSVTEFTGGGVSLVALVGGHLVTFSHVVLALCPGYYQQVLKFQCTSILNSISLLIFHAGFPTTLTYQEVELQPP